MGIADLPTAARRSLPLGAEHAQASIWGYTVHLLSYSLPRDFSTTLEMMGLSTVTLG